MPIDKHKLEFARRTHRHPAGISRRRLLRVAGVGGAALFAASPLISQRADAGNMTQQAAGYQPTPKDGKRCDGCSLFQPPSACKLVAGSIDPAGWCRFWVKKA
jgi:hypothetical protein